jgi:uncharacterized sulfatase
MMRRKKLLASLVLMIALAGAAYINRLHIFKYSLGWYTDIRYPRDANHPVPWMTGPDRAEQPVAQRAPNIIVIMADDLGNNDVTTHGGGLAALGAPTPAIDTIASDGVRFERGYSGAAVCTVSRAALMTGRYPWRFGVEFTPTPGAMARVASQLYADPQRLHPIIVDKDKPQVTIALRNARLRRLLRLARLHSFLRRRLPRRRRLFLRHLLPAVRLR